MSRPFAMPTRALAAALLLVPPSALVALAARAQAPAPPASGPVRVLYPANHTAHTGPVRLVVATPASAAAPRATVDGKPLPLQRMAFADTWVLPGKLKQTAALVGDRANTAIWLAVLRPTPGTHTVTVGGRRMEVRVGPGAPPTGWATQWSHRLCGADAAKPDCGTCHEGATSTLGAVPTPKSCAPCHDEAGVQLIHHHVAEPLARCAMCHDPHGSARPKLLVDAKDKLCSKCHALGHSKG